MKLFRFKKADGSSNHVNLDAIQWIESMNQGQSCVIHLAGGGQVKSGTPTDDLVKAIKDALKPPAEPVPVVFTQSHSPDIKDAAMTMESAKVSKPKPRAE